MTVAVSRNYQLAGCEFQVVEAPSKLATTSMDIVDRPTAPQGHSKDYEVYRATKQAFREQGLPDARATLLASRWPAADAQRSRGANV